MRCENSFEKFKFPNKKHLFSWTFQIGSSFTIFDEFCSLFLAKNCYELMFAETG